MQPDPLVIAYLAGVVDSDGFISITRSERKGVLYHGAVVGIAGTSSEPHDLAASLWGGKVRCYIPKVERYRPQFQWSRQGDAAADIIGKLYPYLRVKKENAELAMSLQEHVLDGRGPDPFPWFGPHYDPVPLRERMRAEMVEVLSTRKKAAGRLLDGVTHDGFPA